MDSAASNLGALCRRHRRLKTHSRWRLTQNRGTFAWTSPTGPYTRTSEPLAEATVPPREVGGEPPPF
jgi:hypothetical protein